MAQGQGFTPGPWEADPARYSGPGGTRIFKVVDPRPSGGLIADVSSWWVDIESARANARLIAAAPEGYDLIAAVAAHFENTDAPLGQRARDWLRKARGEGE